MVLHSITNKQITLDRLKNVGKSPYLLWPQSLYPKKERQRRKKMMWLLLMMGLHTASPNRLKCKEHTHGCRPLKPQLPKSPESVRNTGPWPRRRNKKHSNGILLASHHVLWVKSWGELQVRAQAKHRLEWAFYDDTPRKCLRQCELQTPPCMQGMFSCGQQILCQGS